MNTTPPPFERTPENMSNSIHPQHARTGMDTGISVPFVGVVPVTDRYEYTGMV